MRSVNNVNNIVLLVLSFQNDQNMFQKIRVLRPLLLISWRSSVTNLFCYTRNSATNEQGLFVVNASSGVISLNGTLDREAEQEYRLRVLVSVSSVGSFMQSLLHATALQLVRLLCVPSFLRARSLVPVSAS